MTRPDEADVPTQDAATETCTSWDFAPANVCGAEAVVRRGLRCPIGCWGEGLFDYACAEHEPRLAGDHDYGCDRCGATLIWFPLQPIVGVP